MRSHAQTVDAFLEAQPVATRAALSELRRIVRAEAPHAIESMKYGMPVYTLPTSQMLCGFAAQKQYLAFYVGRVPQPLREKLGSGFQIGKGAVRFARLDAEKARRLRELLREVVASGITCA